MQINKALILKEIDINERDINKTKSLTCLFSDHTKNNIERHDSLRKFVLPMVNH